MSVPDELRRYVPRTDLYDSYELISYHMPVEQPPATASYIIFKKGNKTYAKNGTYGHIEYEDTDSATVIQNAIDNLTSGRTWNEKIVIKGNITINETITLSSYTTLEILGKLTLADGADKDMIHITGDYNIVTGELDGNKDNQTATVHGIILDTGDYNLIINCNIRNIAAYGIYITNDSIYNRIIGNTVTLCGTKGILIYDGNQNLIEANAVVKNNGIGIHIADDENVIAGNTAFMNKGDGIFVSGEGNTIVGNQVDGNEGHGIEISGNNNTIVGNITRDNGYKTPLDNLQAGIRLTGNASHNLIAYNSSINVNFNNYGQRYGVEVVSSTNVENIIIGNDLTPNKTAPLYDAGTGTIIKWNRGHLVGSEITISVDAGSTQTITQKGTFIARLGTNTSLEYTPDGGTTWHTLIAAGETGTIVSDGSSLRLNNAGASAEDSYLLPIG